MERRSVDCFLGRKLINEMTEFSPARDDPIWAGNSVLIEIEPKKYMFFGVCLYTSETARGKNIKLAANMGNNCVSSPVAYGEKQIFSLIGRLQLILYDSLKNKNMRRVG